MGTPPHPPTHTQEVGVRASERCSHWLTWSSSSFCDDILASRILPRLRTPKRIGKTCCVCGAFQGSRSSRLGVPHRETHASRGPPSGAEAAPGGSQPCASSHRGPAPAPLPPRPGPAATCRQRVCCLRLPLGGSSAASVTPSTTAPPRSLPQHPLLGRTACAGGNDVWLSRAV